MRAAEYWTRRASENRVVAQHDLAATQPELEADRARLLQTLLSCQGDLLLYRPDQHHYAVGFGEFGDNHVRFAQQLTGDIGGGVHASLAEELRHIRVGIKRAMRRRAGDARNIV